MPADGTPRAGAGRPRLLLVTPDFPPAPGGIQSLMGGLAAGLDGFEVRVVTARGAGAREHDARLSLRTRRVPAPPRLRLTRHLPLNAAVLLEARAFRPDVFLSGHIVASPATGAVARLQGAPVAQYFHANEIADKPRLAARAARGAAASIVVSRYAAGLLAEVEHDPPNLRIIPPGIRLPPPSERPGPGADPPTFVTVSRLVSAYKGHDVLLRALPAVRERVPGATWVIIGDGPLRAGLESQARAAGVGDAVRFLGALADSERDDWLARADVFAMPSRLPGGRLAGEGFGIAYLEAAAHGTPTLAGNVGGALDAVVDGETGLLVDPSDDAAVGEALARLLSDRELARRLGAAGAARARDFAWPVICGRVEELLTELVSRRSA